MPALVNSNLLVSNDRLESRMRENRQSGSEGGEPQTNAAFLPLSLPVCESHRIAAPPPNTLKSPEGGTRNAGVRKPQDCVFFIGLMIVE
jgi:hypothetical protein